MKNTSLKAPTGCPNWHKLQLQVKEIEVDLTFAPPTSMSSTSPPETQRIKKKSSLRQMSIQHIGGDSSPLSWSKSSLRDRPAHFVGLRLSLFKSADRPRAAPFQRGLPIYRLIFISLKLYFLCAAPSSEPPGRFKRPGLHRWDDVALITFWVGVFFADLGLRHVLRSPHRRRSEVIQPPTFAKKKPLYLHQLWTCFICYLLNLFICSWKSLFPTRSRHKTTVLGKTLDSGTRCGLF